MAKKAKSTPRKARKSSAKIVNIRNEIRVTAPEDLTKLMRAIGRQESTKHEAVSTLGGLISNAVEKQFLHKRSFKIYRGLAKLEDHELAATWHHLVHYMTASGVMERATAQGNLFPVAGEPEEPFEDIEDEREDEGRIGQVGRGVELQ